MMSKCKYLFYSSFLFSCFLHSAEMKECSDAATDGMCSDIVDTAINVCEEKQKGHDLTYKTLKKSQETSFSRSTNFGQLVQKYKDSEKSAKKSASGQKVCSDTAKALKKDCEEKCKDSDAASCEKGQDALDDIAKFCKKKKEEAEAIAEQAASDAAAIADAARNITPDTNPGSGPGTQGSSSTSSSKFINSGGPGGPSGTGLGDFLNVKEDTIGGDSTADNNDTSGGTSGGGSTAGGNGVDSNATGLVGAAAGALGAGGGNSAGEGSGSSASGDDAAAMAAAAARYGAGGDRSKDSNSSTANKTSEGAAGYMFWGTPSRKRSRPSLLNRKVVNQVLNTTREPANKVENNSNETKGSAATQDLLPEAPSVK